MIPDTHIWLCSLALRADLEEDSSVYEYYGSLQALARPNYFLTCTGGSGINIGFLEACKEHAVKELLSSYGLLSDGAIQTGVHIDFHGEWRKVDTKARDREIWELYDLSEPTEQPQACLYFRRESITR